MITREMFKRSVGTYPEQDDLDRCNCLQAGEIGHECCGWDAERNMPVFNSWGELRKRMDDTANV